MKKTIKYLLELNFLLFQTELIVFFILVRDIRQIKGSRKISKQKFGAFINKEFA
jgi:hypothetical protein